MRAFGTAPRDVYYVAQENLEELGPRERCVVNNPSTTKYFREFDIWTGRFTCREKLHFAFGLRTEGGGGDATGGPALQALDDALLTSYAQLEGCLASGNIGTNPRVDVVEAYRNNSDRKAKRGIVSRPKKFSVGRKAIPVATEAAGGAPANSLWLRNGDLLALLQAAPDRQAAHVVENMTWVCWMTTQDRQCARYMREGVCNLARGRNEEALSLFKAAMTLQPDLAEVYNKISAICYVRSEYASAVVNANMALKFDSKHYAASAMLGLALMRTTRKFSLLVECMH